jgi:hypothetical protein
MDALEYNQAHGKRAISIETIPGDKVIVTPRSKEMFTAIAKPRYHRKRPIPFDKEIPQRDYFFKLTSLKPSETDVFQRIYATLNFQTNIGLLDQPPEKNKATISRALKGLREKDLVYRIKKGEYMINPWAILPPAGYRVRARAMWDSLK